MDAAWIVRLGGSRLHLVCGPDGMVRSSPSPPLALGALAAIRRTLVRDAAALADAVATGIAGRAMAGPSCVVREGFSEGGLFVAVAALEGDHVWGCIDPSDAPVGFKECADGRFASCSPTFVSPAHGR